MIRPFFFDVDFILKQFSGAKRFFIIFKLQAKNNIVGKFQGTCLLNSCNQNHLIIQFFNCQIIELSHCRINSSPSINSYTQIIRHKTNFHAFGLLFAFNYF
jgi:hypothetical protein